jgi:restriction system protein
MFQPLLTVMQYALPVIFVFGAAISAIKAFRGRKLADQYVATPPTETLVQNAARGSKPTDEMSWQQFELLVGQAFRQAGYRVIDGGEEGADGGVDVRLKKDGHTFFGQCKHWKARSVGVSVVRELYGVIAGAGAKGGFVVTSGDFTEEARAFSTGKHIGLIDGHKLDKMLRSAAKSLPEDALKPSEIHSEIVLCPRCSSRMVKRRARQGANAGQEFWGCSRFPQCRGIRN